MSCKNIKLVEQHLYNNGYPRVFVKFNINKKIHIKSRNKETNTKIVDNVNNTQNFDRAILIVKIPYIKNFFESIT